VSRQTNRGSFDVDIALGTLASVLSFMLSVRNDLTSTTLVEMTRDPSSLLVTYPLKAG
jgi:hypothetical protein